MIQRAKQPLSQRQAVSADASVQQFSLEQGQIDVGRTLPRAGLAGKAIAQRRV